MYWNTPSVHLSSSSKQIFFFSKSLLCISLEPRVWLLVRAMHLVFIDCSLSAFIAPWLLVGCDSLAAPCLKCKLTLFTAPWSLRRRLIRWWLRPVSVEISWPCYQCIHILKTVQSSFISFHMTWQSWKQHNETPHWDWPYGQMEYIIRFAFYSLHYLFLGARTSFTETRKFQRARWRINETLSTTLYACMHVADFS
jgi:hypothetical protein